MSKTAETLAIEKALYKYTKAGGLGIYGCFEVSLGAGYGNERVDFMTLSSDDEFRCYEIKVSKADFQSKAKLSFLGDFNYLVIPSRLLPEIQDLESYAYLLVRGTGILLFHEENRCGSAITIERKPKKKRLSLSDRISLMHCMARSLSRYCKYYFVNPKLQKATVEFADQIKSAVSYGCLTGYDAASTKDVSSQVKVTAEKYFKNTYPEIWKELQKVGTL